MAYRFRLDERLDDGVRRIGAEQIARALKSFAACQDRDEAVHGARKRLKRVRALLLLARPALGGKIYNAENARFRDIGQKLAGKRDLHVLGQTANALADSAPVRAKAAMAALKRTIVETKTRAEAGDNEDSARAGMEALGEAESAFAVLPIEGDDIRDLAKGLKRAFAKCHAAFAVVQDDPTDESVHEFRKTVQRHWRHMQLLERAWPDYFRARAELASELAECLGQDHDLAMVAAFAERNVDAGLTEKQQQSIAGLVSSRQDKLRERMQPLSLRLLAETPKDIARQVELYWETAPAPKKKKSHRAVEAEIVQETAPLLRAIEDSVRDSEQDDTLDTLPPARAANQNRLD
jgi:hypothetical protein